MFRLSDVLIDDDTGAAIVPGRLHLADANGQIGAVPAHDLILLDLGGAGLTCRAVTSFERLPSGFCKAATADPHVWIGELRRDVFTAITVGLRGGQRSVKSSYRVGHASAKRYAVVYEIDHYDLAEEYVVEGLSFTLTGTFKALAKGPEPGVNDGFRVQGTIPWPTLAVKGYPAGGSHKFGHRAKPLGVVTEPPAADPQKLDDVMMSSGLAWPYVRGSLQFSEAGGRQLPIRGTHFVCARFDSGRLAFKNADRLQRYDDGFYWHLNSDDYSLDFARIGTSYFDEAFRTVDRFRFACEDDLLGGFHRSTRYGMEPGDPYGGIAQKIASCVMHAALERAGMRLTVEGRLRDFDPKLIENHRRERDSTIQPVESYKVETILPWALLHARDFAVAKRRREFL